MKTSNKAPSLRRNPELIKDEEMYCESVQSSTMVWICNKCEAPNQTCVKGLSHDHYRCMCNHLLASHTLDGYACSVEGCACGRFTFLSGSRVKRQPRCECKHKHGDHEKLWPRKCQRPICNCQKFVSSWKCPCGHSWSAHATRFTKRKYPGGTRENIADHSAAAKKRQSLNTSSESKSKSKSKRENPKDDQDGNSILEKMQKKKDAEERHHEAMIRKREEHQLRKDVSRRRSKARMMRSRSMHAKLPRNSTRPENVRGRGNVRAGSSISRSSNETSMESNRRTDEFNELKNLERVMNRLRKMELDSVVAMQMPPRTGSIEDFLSEMREKKQGPQRNAGRKSSRIRSFDERDGLRSKSTSKYRSGTTSIRKAATSLPSLAPMASTSAQVSGRRRTNSIGPRSTSRPISKNCPTQNESVIPKANSMIEKTGNRIPNLGKPPLPALGTKTSRTKVCNDTGDGKQFSRAFKNSGRRRAQNLERSSKI
mmetsp:Transcript_25513/g.61465  ORF Transcript_25513/g.61465 Transcript_25513/m.61465 type:complete len:483 (-) Transcript_25513:217-1665(-)